MYTSCFRSCRNYLRSEEGDKNASNRYDRDRRRAAGIAGEGIKAGIWNLSLSGGESAGILTDDRSAGNDSCRTSDRTGKSPLQAGYFKILLKIIGITYVAEFASDLCKDAGYATIAGQIQMFGKLTVLAAGIPVLTALLETIRGFLS